jgi:outer membrane protein
VRSHVVLKMIKDSDTGRVGYLRIFILGATILTTLVSTGLSTEIGLTIAEARQRAILSNRRYLSAKEEINKASAQVTQAKAGVFPDVSVAGSWDHNFKVPSFLLVTSSGPQKIEMGLPNSFGATLNIQQAIWNGGKVFTAYQIAKLYREYTADNAKSAEDQIIYSADVIFYSTILQDATLDVLKKSLEAASKNLDVAEKLYSKGMVPQFELLRARVEKANLLPAIFQAEAEAKMAQQRLKSFLGINLGDTIHLVEEPDDTSLARLPALTELTRIALEKRSELEAATHLTKITGKAITIARSDYQPSLDAYARWNWQAQSREFRFDQNQSHSTTAGLSLRVPIFNGGRTGGQVSFRKAENMQAQLAEAQQRDDITLEVEDAYNQIIQAKKSLDVQKETIAQAEEGQRIANVRYESGEGTQLEVLSAQAALTQARQAHALALFQFRQAKAGVRKASTIDVDVK